MTQALTKPITFDEFIKWYPESEIRYELHDGVIVEMPKPRGKHSRVAGFVIKQLNIAISNLDKENIWFIPRESIVKTLDKKSGYEPDIIVLDEEKITDEPRWESESIIENASSIKLIVEVVSTNWRDDYFRKSSDYEEMGIQEYWIIDYAALGGRRFIGNPKQPTISVYQLIEGEYQITQFREDEQIVSSIFPTFNLTANQVFNCRL
ncbi:Uma2 family endonuclease [Nostoc sp. CHAB 5715]|uniref:Uma2 family endonuclease n=1 Tax=Nostoc sp. CHAB 5715 TaxID=2780400 RepID=UPI001E5A86BD|nr:Uma2 family endonuclease [Nostoc sp. CHAB 5715]MCC5622255.1 Uma2 family endonuclease [Nostoc sp. CHAB 5715]